MTFADLKTGPLTDKSCQGPKDNGESLFAETRQKSRNKNWKQNSKDRTAEKAKNSLVDSILKRGK